LLLGPVRKASPSADLGGKRTALRLVAIADGAIFALFNDLKDVYEFGASG